MAMNLRGLVNTYTRGINPNTRATRKRSNGYNTDAAGKRTPIYDDCPVTLQVQALSFGDLQQLDGLNIQGTRRAIYTNGVLSGVIRVAQKGGDLIVFPAGVMPEGNTWLCVHVLEQWGPWCKVAITLQND